MKVEDNYLEFVKREDEDAPYVGYCPDLFPWARVCQPMTEEQTYGQLCALARAEK